MSKRTKHYVVWKGHQPGVYTSWADCQAQIAGFPGAQYKSFARREDALAAFEKDYDEVKGSDTKTFRLTPDELRAQGVILDSVCVDAACKGNPGDVEYRGVDPATGEELFRKGPYPQGTQNLGEFLAIVHALAWLKNLQRDCPVYSDSETAMAWVRRGQARTKMRRSAANRRIFALVERAMHWLAENSYPNRILKWRTDQWGEIPADFGRK
jgi:ribonuclease HI